MLFQQSSAGDAISLDARYFGPAEVVAVAETHVSVTLGIQQLDAQLAVVDYLPRAGDQVLVLGDWPSGFFVIGVLQTVSSTPRMTFCRNPKTGGARIEVGEGDLELVARHGNIRLVSAGGIEMTAMDPIDVRSRIAVRMSIFGRVGQMLTKLNLFDRNTEMSSQSIDLTAENLRAKTTRTSVSMNKIDADFDDARISGRRINMVADVIVSKAKNVYQRVSELWQLAAGRTRTVVDGTSHHKANRIYSKAVKDVKIDGEKIHLG
jgi:hypothetical protein